MENISPRLLTPGVDSVYSSLSESLDADVVVVGAGIAGCMTAYFLLKNTNRKVVLLDANRIARGASGHNAGQIDVFFETPVKELIETYGLHMVKEGYEAMFDAWLKLDEMVDSIGWQGQYAKYIGYNVYTTKEQLFEVCEQLYLFDELGLEINELFVREGGIDINDIPEKYRQYINFVSIEIGGQCIGSTTVDWLCYEATHYATVNSATLCHALVKHMLSEYQNRLAVYENTGIKRVYSTDTNIILSTILGDTISAYDVVFCTNAYRTCVVDGEEELFRIDAIKGYMAGYYVSEAKVPTTIGYQPPTNSYTDGYYYHSVRHYYDMEHTEHTLVSLGGPDIENPTEEYPIDYKNDLDAYIKKFYNHEIKGSFYRSGEMGYTDTGLRKIGPHKKYHHIRYNVGCNGVGILGSIHGGRKIAEFFLKKVSEKSIFDI